MDAFFLFALDDLERGLISEVIVGYGDTVM